MCANVYLPIILQWVERIMKEKVNLYIVFLHHKVIGVVVAKLSKAQPVDVEVARSILMTHGQLGVNGCKHMKARLLISGNVYSIHGYAYAEHGLYAIVGVCFFVVEPFVEFLGWFLEVYVLPGIKEAFANEHILGFCGSLHG